MLDITFLMMVIANTVKFSFFHDEMRECLCNVYNVFPADRSCRR